MAGVTQMTGFAARKTRLLNRWEARRAGIARPMTAFDRPPEPRTIGLFARGKQLVAGHVLLAGQMIETRGETLWAVAPPGSAFGVEAQGFAWLDDLAALGDSAARICAQTWTWDWIARYGAGRGPGWTPDLAGRRVIRWINHATLLLTAKDAAAEEVFLRALARQVMFLARRWAGAAPGLPRFEALTGLIYAGLSLTGMADHVAPASAALARDCADEIDAMGGIPTRNPEELLEIFTLLSWAAQALGEAGRMVPPAHLAAIERIAPTLRALRHADGGLARFHGGGRGLEGRLDHALANAGVRAVAAQGLAMGFARLAGGRTTVIVDAAEPPNGRAGRSAHASVLAFELTSGRRPVVVNCGSGAPFGPDWRRAGRATASHSTLSIDGFSSSRLGGGAQEVMIDRARLLTAHQSHAMAGHHMHMAHAGWSQTHGLTHQRDILLAADGRRLTGQDVLAALTPGERKRFGYIISHSGPRGIRFAIRFHLHPDVDAAVDMGGSAISLALKSGEIWVFRHEGAAVMSLEPSVYLEKGRLQPRATKQVVLTGTATDFETRIGWTLAKAQDTPLAIRDLDRD